MEDDRVSPNVSAGYGPTRNLASLARSLEHATLPGEVRLIAKTCILDWLGVTLAGSREPLSEILIEEVTSSGGDARSTIIGHRTKVSSLLATLVNGSASHALDFDDTHLLMMGHPSAPVLPALMALGEERRSQGSSLLAAFVSGVETECRLGALLGGGHYAAGWHSTATLGTFGAAAACAHLLGLDEEQWLHAFGLAGTQAAGLKSVFGTMSKPFHAGKASMNGLLAARLASRGFTSNTEILETHLGFAATHAGRPTMDGIDRYKDRYLILDTVFKYHAACYLTHSSIESALRIKEENKFDAGSVERVEVIVPQGHLDVCNIHDPVTGLEGKFSLRATVAMALLGIDTTDTRVYTDERMRDRELVAVRDRVGVTPSGEVAGTESKVSVVLKDATTLTAAVDTGQPERDLELQWERLTSKFMGLAAPIVGDERAWELHARVRGFEEMEDAGELLELCRPAEESS